MKKAKMHVTNKIVAVFLSLVMVVGLIPTTVFASAEGYDEFYTVTVQNEEGNPIEDATVQYEITINTAAEEPEVSGSALTDENGVWAIDLSQYDSMISKETPASLEYTISMEGYETKTPEEPVIIESATGDIVVTLEEAMPAPVGQHNVTVAVTGDATVKLNDNEQNTITVDEGTEVKVEIIPNEGSYVKTVNGETVAVAKGESYTDTFKVESDVAISATVVKEYSVTVKDYEGGTVTLNGEEKSALTVDENAVVKLAVEAKEGYQISSISIDGNTESITDVSLYSKDITITGNTEIVVDFVKVFIVEVIHSENGTVVTNPESMGGSVVVETGTEVSIKATPNENYRVSEVKINDEVTVKDTENNYIYEETLTVDKKYTVEITFSPNQFTVSAEETINGSVSIEKETVNYNGQTTVNIYPNAGYTVESVKVNGVDTDVVTPDDTTIYFVIDEITEDKTALVTFKKVATTEMSNVEFNSKDALRANIDGTLYVFSNNTTVTFKTEKSGIRLYDTQGKVIGGSWKEKSIDLSETKIIGKIEVFYKAEGDWSPAWHEVNVISKQNPLSIVIDKDPASCKIKPEKSNKNGFYNSNVSVDISAEDTGYYSGIATIEYWVTSKGAVTQGKGFINEAGETETGLLYSHDGANIENIVNKNIIVDTSNGKNNSDEVVVHVTVTDRAGNTKTYETEALKINTTRPTINVSIDGELSSEAEEGYYNSPRTATVTYVDRASSFDEMAAMNGIDIKAVDVKGKPITIAKQSMIEWQHSNDVHTATITFAENANYEWSVKYTNKADLSNDGILSETGDSIYKFTVDNEKPNQDLQIELDSSVWDELISDLTFGIWKDDSVTAVATGSDAISPVKEIEYYKSNETKALDREALEELYEAGEFTTSKYTISADEKFVVYARITDYGGNSEYISTNGVVYDDTESDIIWNVPESNKDGYHNKNFNIEVTVKDAADENKAYSGIKSISYKIEKDGEVTASDTLWTFEVKNPSYEELVGEKTVVIPVDAYENSSDHVKVTVMVEDNAGNPFEESVDVAINTDKIESTITFEDEANKVVDEHGYFGSSRTATITVIDRATSFDEEAATKGITFERTKENSEESKENDVVISSWKHDGDTHIATVTFNADGKYTWSFNYKNKADNYLEDINVSTGDSVTPYSFTVDKTNPTGTVSINENTWDRLLKTLTFGLYSNEKVDIKATADDITSPYIIEYYETDNTTALTDDELDEKEFEPFIKYSVESDKQIVVYLKVTDYAGNYTYISSNGYIVDKTPSDITLTPSEANGFYDEEENKSGQYGLYNINSDVKVDIRVEESEPYSGIKSVEYWIENNNVETKRETIFTFDKADPAQSELVRAVSKTIGIDKEANNSCNVVVYVKTIDNAGMENTESIKLDIDNTAPTIDVSFDNNQDNEGNTYFDEQRTATVVITERTHHFNAVKATEGIVIEAVDANGDNVVDANGDNVVDAYTISEWDTVENAENPDKTTHTATIFFEKDANYTWSIAYEDEAGNANVGVETGDSVAPFDFTVDTLEPNGTVTAVSYVDNEGNLEEGRKETWDDLREESALTFGFWSKEKIEVSGTSDDATSPIASVEYYKTNGTTALTADLLDEVTQWTNFEGLGIAEDEQFTVYIKITDKAGNYKYIRTEGMIVDHAAPVEETIAPEITIDPVQPINGLYNGDVKVSVKVSDPSVGGTYSGLKTVSYKVFNLGEETQYETLYSFDNAAPTQENLEKTIEREIVVNSELNNSNDVKIVIYAEDNSLNSSQDEVSIQIDITKPTIDISYDNNAADSGTYFKADRTATVVVTERNFNPEDVKITIENTDGIIPTVNGWKETPGKESGNMDDTTWTATIKYEADGDYKFNIEYTDLADNECEDIDYGESVAPTAFTIDETIPVVSVSYDNNSAQNGKYFKANRTATVTVNEHNFDVSRVKFTQTSALNGATIATPTATWTNNGDIHTAVIAYTADGDYTFDVAVTDMAGNESEPANYGNSVAGKDFTIDTNIEKPTIGGVNNGSAYKDEVIPSISFSDVNFDSYEVQLVRTRKGERNVDVTSEFIKALSVAGQEGSGVFDTFEEIAENDGIYTLTVRIVDKAGNEETEQYTFTVNRFGSVYEYSKTLSDLIANGGAYVGAVTEDLVITEYNADKLLSDSLKIEITRDGRPLENVIYNVSPVINDQVSVGDSGWYQYQYTISKANFAQDGVYKISIASADATGNLPENANYEDMGILFRVDSTVPEITSIVGLEEAIINAEQVEVKYTVFDAIGLKSIEIYINGELVDEITDFSADMNNYSGSFIVSEDDDVQSIVIRVNDMAGNVTDTSADDFSSEYVFNDEVTITTKWYIRWYANKPLFWGSIAGVVGLLAIFFIILARRKRDDGEE